MIRIYHTSDLHDRRGIVAPIRRLRAENPGLYFDCGDSLRGSQTIYRRFEPIVAELDAAGCDAQAIGNREFHYLYALLCARALRIHHPLVCTNLQDVKGRALPFVPSLRLNSTGANGAGLNVHVLGLLVVQYPRESPWERVLGWRFLDPADAISPYVERVPKGEPLIVLSHLGLRRDRELAKQFPRIDLLLGGHSHDTLETPEYAGAVPIVHAGPYGRFVSRTVLEYEPNLRRFAVRDFALLPLLSPA